MNDLALCVPALLLALFCLIYSQAVRRALYFPPPKGALAKARNHHTVFLAMLCALSAASRPLRRTAASASPSAGAPASSFSPKRAITGI